MSGKGAEQAEVMLLDLETLNAKRYHIRPEVLEGTLKNALDTDGCVRIIDGCGDHETVCISGDVNVKTTAYMSAANLRDIVKIQQVLEGTAGQNAKK